MHFKFDLAKKIIVDMLRGKRKLNHIKCSFKITKNEKSGKYKWEQRTRVINREENEHMYYI